MNKHTPGPWDWKFFGDSQLVILGAPTDDKKQTLVAVITGEERKTNARLIAAAPELLAALDALYNDWITYSAQDINDGNTDACGIEQQTLNAIKKAGVQDE